MLSSVVNKLSSSWELRKLCYDDQHLSHVDEFSWLTVCTKGIYLVRLVQPRVIDHCTVVDCDNQWILDCAEKSPIHLCVECLHLCGGVEATDLKIVGIRRLAKPFQ